MCICVGLVVAHLLRDVAGHAPIGVLVDCGGYQAGNVPALPIALQEARHRLERRVPREADVVGVGEAEDRLHGAHGDPLRDLQSQFVDVLYVVSVAEDVCELRFYAAGDDVQGVVVCVANRLVERQVFAV